MSNLLEEYDLVGDACTIPSVTEMRLAAIALKRDRIRRRTVELARDIHEKILEVHMNGDDEAEKSYTHNITISGTHAIDVGTLALLAAMFRQKGYIASISDAAGAMNIMLKWQ